jgi:mRNA interferase HigB
VISRKKRAGFSLKHRDAEAALDVWYRAAKSSAWSNLQEVREVYPHADAVGKWTVFTIRGNRYRLIAEIGYRSRIVFVRHILTHSEYDRGESKP